MIILQHDNIISNNFSNRVLYIILHIRYNNNNDVIYVTRDDPCLVNYACSHASLLPHPDPALHHH